MPHSLPPLPAQPGSHRDLVETMRFTPEEGVKLLEHHLARLSARAAALGFGCDRHALRNTIQALCFEIMAPSRLALWLAPSGASSLEITPLPSPPDANRPLGCIALTLPAEADCDALEDAGLAAARAHGADAAVLVDAEGWLVGAFGGDIFLAREGGLITPPLAPGLQPSVLRLALLAATPGSDPSAREAALSLGALEAGFLIGDPLHGLLRARLLG